MGLLSQLGTEDAFIPLFFFLERTLIFWPFLRDLGKTVLQKSQVAKMVIKYISGIWISNALQIETQLQGNELVSVN